MSLGFNVLEKPERILLLGLRDAASGIIP